eukprot:TRINITY_DN63518_c0_g1_i1.p1 TRINITY_DN63518_c0_g1~~TRINITY_DN63518_c0_g1_i1.p1  ORF type:complete len:411 (-),score=91.62 TRINITY_DN63518_c0_g1_i1:164-1396(-)
MAQIGSLILVLALTGATAESVCRVGDPLCMAEDDSVGLLQAQMQTKGKEVRKHELDAGVGTPKVDDVVGTIMHLSDQGLQFNIGKNPKVFPRKGYNQHVAPYSTHFQSVFRLPHQDGQTGNYFVLTGASDEAAHLFVAKVASADGAGHLMGQSKGFDVMKDKVIKTIVVDKQYTHAGGPAMFGNYLVVGAEKKCSFIDRMGNKCDETSVIHFYDFSDPENPTKLPYTIKRREGPAGAVAISKQDDGTFLLIVGRADSAILDFYQSEGTDLATDPKFGSIKHTWRKANLKVQPGRYLDKDFRSYQNLALVDQSDGKRFLVGMTRAPLLIGKDWLEVFELSMKGTSPEITKVASKKTKCKGCDFYAGSGIFVESESSVLAYGVDWNPDGKGRIILNEFIPAKTHARQFKGSV